MPICEGEEKVGLQGLNGTPATTSTDDGEDQGLCLVAEDVGETTTAMRQFFVSSLTGETRVLSGDVSVREVRQQVAAWGGAASATDVRLMYSGRDLEDSEQIPDGATLFSALRLLGGGKKRKKKNYTTPKKTKHTKKKVAMATLKYYKVSDDGEVTRERKTCPADICGPGIFMSEHKDRYYCGKCALTYVKE